MDCPDVKILSSYLDEGLRGARRQDIEAHISECSSCLDLLVVAYDAQGRKRRCPASLEEKVRAMLGLGKKKPRHE